MDEKLIIFGIGLILIGFFILFVGSFINMNGAAIKKTLVEILKVEES